MIYGSEIILENEKLRQKLDHIFHADVILVKLVLAVLAFDNVTSNLSSTSQHDSKSIDNQWNSSSTLLTIQNHYLDILWRYMLFRFRQEQIVIHLFSKIIYNCLHVQTFSSHVAKENDKHIKICMTC